MKIESKEEVMLKRVVVHHVNWQTCLSFATVVVKCYVFDHVFNATK